jgi:hypothetical protein
VAVYASFRELLEQEGVRHVLPGTSRPVGAVYGQFYGAEDEALHGVLGIHLSVIDDEAKELFSAANRLASAKQWSSANEWNLCTRLLSRLARRQALSFLDGKTCKKLDKLAKELGNKLAKELAKDPGVERALSQQYIVSQGLSALFFALSSFERTNF